MPNFSSSYGPSLKENDGNHEQLCPVGTATWPASAKPCGGTKRAPLLLEVTRCQHARSERDRQPPRVSRTRDRRESTCRSDTAPRLRLTRSNRHKLWR